MQRILRCCGSTPAQDNRHVQPATTQNGSTTRPRPANPFSCLPSLFKRRNVDQQVISEVLFSAMSAEKKIQWLCRAVPPLPKDANPGTNLILVGPRVLTRKGVLCLALELAIASRREKVPAIARQLVDEYPADDLDFVVHGVAFTRTDLSNWAREGLAPRLPPSPPPRVTERGVTRMEEALHQPNSQNVHNPQVTRSPNEQLGVIRKRVPQTARISQSEAIAEIRTYLATRPTAAAERRGLGKVVGLTGKVTDFSDSVQGSLSVLWNYIRAVPDPVMKKNLKESMAARLSEIGREDPCVTGMITRIIDIPTAVDWTLTSETSVENLRDELQTLASQVYENCEDDPGIGEQTGVIPTELSNLVRERFLHTADIQYGMLRCVDRQLVELQAKRVFPENTEL